MGSKKSRPVSTETRAPPSRKYGEKNKGRYLPPPSSPVYIALFDYKARSQSDISFVKGDLMEGSIQIENNDWLMVRHLSNKKRGLVPTSFVALKDSLQAQDWYFGATSRIEAEELVMDAKNCVGTFILRPSERMPNCYSLTVKDFNPRDGEHPKNYRIKSDNQGGFYITPHLRYPTVTDLITAYQKRHSSSCRLIKPCPKPVPQLWDLAPDLQDAWEIPRNEIVLEKQIGAGQFGEVYYGKWRGTINVAVKTLKPGSMSATAFLEEATIMKKFRHTKLVSLYAVCSLEEPMYIVTEYMSNGSLLSYLRKSGPLVVKLGHLIYIVSQVAAGMAYLESRDLVHRDLAARNILIGDNHCAKVADFGLARVVSADNKLDNSAQSNLMPVKWTAPEAFRFSKFSTKSDVWSFGIVLMETFTYGEKPYPNMTPNEVLQALKTGYRMPKPKNHTVPDQVYEKMCECWKDKPEERPTFEHLAFYFENYEYTSEDIYE